MGAPNLERGGWRGPGEVGEDSVLSGRIIACAMNVHSTLGPGLLESAYEACLCRALSTEGLVFKRQQEIPIQFQGLNLDCGFRLDLMVEDRIVVEIKSVANILPLHLSQLRTYLKLSKREHGLLINFNTRHLRDGIRRMGFTIHSPASPGPPHTPLIRTAPNEPR